MLRQLQTVICCHLLARLVLGNGCNISIVDIADNAHTLGLAACDLDKRVATQNGQVFSNNEGESHKYGQHAGPHWLVQAIKASAQYTEDLDKADIIFVDDYCYTMSHIGMMHGGSFTDGFDPKTDLELAYNQLTTWPRFRKSAGSDFVFYSPHPLAGVASTSKKCLDFGRSLHIVVDASQIRACKMPAKNNYIIAPYASTHVYSLQNLSNTVLLQFVEDEGPWLARKNLMFFLATCAQNSYGKKMRRLLVKLVHQSGKTSDGDDSFVHCSEEPNVPVQAHSDLRRSMRQSVFCIVLPGDSASSRRLTEAMLAGCIPVFLGPPWSSMPLAGQVNYSQIALFFQLAEFQKLERKSQGFLPDWHSWDASWGPFDFRGWSPDADISDSIVSVSSVSHMIDTLRNFDQDRIEQLQHNGGMASSLFRFRHLSTEDPLHLSPTAPDAIMDLLCRKVQKDAQ